jgi:hypothetical protein
MKSALVACELEATAQRCLVLAHTVSGSDRAN